MWYEVSYLDLVDGVKVCYELHAVAEMLFHTLRCVGVDQHVTVGTVRTVHVIH